MPLKYLFIYLLIGCIAFSCCGSKSNQQKFNLDDYTFNDLRSFEYSDGNLYYFFTKYKNVYAYSPNTKTASDALYKAIITQNNTVKIIDSIIIKNGRIGTLFTDTQLNIYCKIYPSPIYTQRDTPIIIGTDTSNYWQNDPKGFVSYYVINGKDMQLTDSIIETDTGRSNFGDVGKNYIGVYPLKNGIIFYNSFRDQSNADILNNIDIRVKNFTTANTLNNRSDNLMEMFYYSSDSQHKLSVPNIFNDGKLNEASNYNFAINSVAENDSIVIFTVKYTKRVNTNTQQTSERKDYNIVKIFSINKYTNEYRFMYDFDYGFIFKQKSKSLKVNAKIYNQNKLNEEEYGINDSINISCFTSPRVTFKSKIDTDIFYLFVSCIGQSNELEIKTDSIPTNVLLSFDLNNLTPKPKKLIKWSHEENQIVRLDLLQQEDLNNLDNIKKKSSLDGFSYWETPDYLSNQIIDLLGPYTIFYQSNLYYQYQDSKIKIKKVNI